MSEYIEIYPTDAQDLISKNKGNSNFVIVDVRTDKEFGKGHIEGALHYDVYDADFEKKILALDKAKVYVVYCRVGARSRATAEFMVENGFGQVYTVRGSMFESEEDLEE